MLYDRTASLFIRLSEPQPSLNYRGSLEIRNLRVAFSILKSESWSTNNATIRVWNIGFSNRNELKRPGDLVTLRAGYVENGGESILFIGSTTSISHSFAQPEVITTFDCNDGDKSINNTLTSLSFAANVQVKTVIQAYADALSLPIATTTEFNALESKTYALGHKYAGLARNGLDIACKNLGLVWSVQNDKLVILKQFQGTLKPPVEINLSTGMIGVPERYGDRRQLPFSTGYKTGYKVRTLLRPDIIPGDRIRLRSEKLGIDQVFYVITIRHEGDTDGDTYQSTLEVIET